MLLSHTLLGCRQRLRRGPSPAGVGPYFHEVKVARKPARNLVTIYLPPIDRERLESMAERGGISRSMLIRYLLGMADGVTPATIRMKAITR